MKNKMTKNEAAAILRRNGHEVIGPMGVIYLNGRAMGIKLWGAIDCLCNHHEFRVVHG